MAESAAALLDAHPRVRVVTVDFFDTLVTRRWAQPTHVFADMERVLVAVDPSRRGFAAARVEAEHRARVRAATDDPHRDVTLAEIHLELSRMLNLDLDERHRLAAMERALEVASVRPGGLAVEVAEEARRRGLRVVVVSDNYMPSVHLVDMARAAGLEWLEASDIFVSCEHGGQKHNGRLWRTVISSLGVRGSRILHVGDDPHADNVVPAGMGVRTHLVPHLRTSHRHMRNTAPSVLPLSRIEADLRDAGVTDRAEVLGRGAIAIVVASQVRHGLAEARSRGAHDVHFAARDGHLAHGLWTRLRERDPSMPRASYTSFSRSVVWRAMLERLDADNVHRFVGDDEVLTPERLGHRVGCALVGAEPGVALGAAAAREVLVANADAVLAAARTLRSRFLTHLRRRGLLDDGLHLVVDLGWTASTVADLADLVAHETGGRSRIEGLFTGLYWDATPNRTRLGMRGIAMDEFAPLDDNLRLLGIVKYMEALVTAPHGSVVDFDGDGSPIGAETAPERRAWDTVVGRVASAATESAWQMLTGSHPSGVRAEDLDGSAVWAAIMQVAHTPTPAEVEMLSVVHHVTDIDHEGEGRPVVAPPPAWRTHITDAEFLVIHDSLIRRHWLRGSMSAWRNRGDGDWMVDEIERMWPHTQPVWVHGGVPR
ncbi:MAG: HAD family hydrolase [Actinomycetota bacterium]